MKPSNAWLLIASVNWIFFGLCIALGSWAFVIFLLMALYATFGSFYSEGKDWIK